MHDKIYKHFDNIDNVKVTEYQESPIPIWVVDDFLPQDVYNAVVEDAKNLDHSCFSVFENETSHRKECRNMTKAPLLQSLTYSFNGANIIKWIEQKTGIDGLIADHSLTGGGFCKVFPGSSLGLHTDFNWNDQIKLNRKVNLILYTNEEWHEEYNGALEFWNFDKTKCVKKLDPKPNRLAFWIYDTELVHGFPDPIKSPTGVSRDNLIIFYYTSNATWDKDPRRSQFE